MHNDISSRWRRIRGVRRPGPGRESKMANKSRWPIPSVPARNLEGEGPKKKRASNDGLSIRENVQPLQGHMKPGAKDADGFRGKLRRPRGVKGGY
jgi:hypothetical protein